MFVKRRKNVQTVSDVVSANVGMSIAEFNSACNKEPHIHNLDKAVALTNRYLARHPKGPVTVVGDYDSDGINATAIMFWAFARKGAVPKLRLPHRFSEGYGLSEKIIDEVDSGLLITVDNGIAAVKAVRKAKAKGLTVIVTDHHLPPVDDKTFLSFLPKPVCHNRAIKTCTDYQIIIFFHLSPLLYSAAFRAALIF